MSEHNRDPSPSPWLAAALTAIDRLPGTTEADDARRAMARRICRAAEIDDPRFPVPEVFTGGGRIFLHWIVGNGPGKAGEAGEAGDARRIEVVISRGASFRWVAWSPGRIADVVVVNKDHEEHARRMFDEFWPGGNGATEAEMMALTEIKRR